ncbi:MAG: hypothetical protein ACOX45_06705 [Acutalibacteraceae bacterium]
MKTEYAEKGGFLQRDGVEHKEYAEAYSTDKTESKERDGADLLERILDRDNLNKVYKRVKSNKGAAGIDGMTVEDALPWLKEHGDETSGNDKERQIQAVTRAKEGNPQRRRRCKKARNTNSHRPHNPTGNSTGHKSNL